MAFRTCNLGKSVKIYTRSRSARRTLRFQRIVAILHDSERLIVPEFVRPLRDEAESPLADFVMGISVGDDFLQSLRPRATGDLAIDLYPTVLG